ncbi:MAG TPA: prolipoprotein diacylglyceryl transferase [Candidatus Woesearchaeota archaeon]|nr:prolipoprotein diacylglyceryl transferase [Candidatus Woesearchaeota archaeon]
MFFHNINPVLGTIGPLEIRYYGLVYALGFLVTYFLLRWAAKKKKIKNLTPSRADTLIIYLILGAIIGARLFLFIFYHPIELIRKPFEVLMLWHGGMSFHGGIIGVVIAGLLFCKKHKISFYELADLLVIPAAFFLFLGRIANFINGELVGIRTSVPWCVVFKDYEGCRHPSQIYEALKNLLIFFVLLFLYTKKSLKKKLGQGIIFWSFVIMYGMLRFVVTFWREDPRFLGLSIGQYLCLLMIIIGSVALLFMRRRTRGK